MLKTVFLDRDGVINEDTGYPHKIEDFKLLPKVTEALQMLIDNEFRLIIITNQSGIGRGYFKEEDFWHFQNHMIETLAQENIYFDGVYFCPHHPEENCLCRKPATGLVDQAKKDFQIDLEKSFLIGDAESDVLCAKNAGLKSVLLTSELENCVAENFSALNLYEAAKIITNFS